MKKSRKDPVSDPISNHGSLAREPFYLTSRRGFELGKPSIFPGIHGDVNDFFRIFRF
jgi:hypothetical protein